MKAIWNRFSDWCNSHIGIVTLLAGFIAIIPYFIDKMHFPSIGDCFSLIIHFFLYKLQVTIYQLLIAAIVISFYIFRARKKYKIQSISQRILVGAWRNDWGPPNSGFENVHITEDLKYFVRGQYYFDIEDFEYDPESNKVRFYKVRVREGNHEKLLNILTIQNNDSLVGIECDYPIRYTRLAQN